MCLSAPTQCACLCPLLLVIPLLLLAVLVLLLPFFLAASSHSAFVATRMHSARVFCFFAPCCSAAADEPDAVSVCSWRFCAPAPASQLKTAQPFFKTFTAGFSFLSSPEQGCTPRPQIFKMCPLMREAPPLNSQSHSLHLTLPQFALGVTSST